jgi:ABC-2 type transport system permease protein
VFALQRHLSFVFLKIFARDRQSIFFSLFFPVIFMTVFGFVNNNEPEQIPLGVVSAGSDDSAMQLMGQLERLPAFDIHSGTEQGLRQRLQDGDLSAVLLLPERIDPTGTELRLLVDAADVQTLALLNPLLERALLQIERELRDTRPLFTLAIEDVQARSQNYLAFLLPGLLAFTLMQLSIAGSGFNIVEYRRKGILKRLFVTPIRPRDFIAAIVVARTLIVLVQLTVLILFAVFILDIAILGSYPSLYLVILFATLTFLCLGFTLGSLAKTQQAAVAIGNIIIFPQVFLSGVFYPIESMPALIQPLATVLPLSFVTTAMRGIANDGATLLDLSGSLTGVAVWLVIAFMLATRLFVWKEVAR